MKMDSCDGLRLNKREFLSFALSGVGGCLLRSYSSHNLAAPLEELLRDGQSRTPGKWSKEALFYEKSGESVQCLKCPHQCVLGPDQAGVCRNRINVHGVLYTIAYGNPCAVHVDPVEKKPLFHFLPGSRTFSIAVAGCNLRCLNCQNWEISQASPNETDNVDLPPASVVDQAQRNGCSSIAYTYSEPNTFYEYGFDTSALAHRHSIRNIWKSSGYINEQPLRKLCSVIDAANIDLKGFDERVYRELNGASLAPVLRTLRVLKEEGVWLEITNLIVPTWTDDLGVIRKMCDWLCQYGLGDVPLHFSRFTPLYKLTNLPLTPVSTLEQARDAAMKAGMRFVYIGNVPGHPAENTSCPRCGAVVLERRGFVIVKNNVAGGACKFCGEKLPGVWS